jgi:hypothetical protein
MTTTHTRTKFLTAAVGAVVATIAAPALLFLGAGTAQAVIHNLPTPRGCGSCDGFNPQPNPGIYPPEIIDPGSAVGTVLPGADAPKVGDAQNTVGFVVIGG